MKPLSGLRIAVTRARPQAEELAAPLRALGAEVVTAPLIRIVPARDNVQMREAMARIQEFDWIIFTSANGVSVFFDALRTTGNAASLSNISIACVGPATATAARRLGFEPDLMPEEYVGEQIAAALAARLDPGGKRMLLARAAGGDDALPNRLRAAGALVSEIVLYDTAADPDGARLLSEHIMAESLDVLTFTSGSTIRYFAQSIGQPGKAIVAVIGPITARTARQHGLAVHIEAQPHTTDGLVKAIVKHFEENHR
ncbi:MAG: uroporphyrinogen-III synthase [Gemmatimonadota bacterium]